MAALLASGESLRIKSRDLVRRNAWAQAGIEAFVANAVGTGIKPQSLSTDDAFKAAVQALWRDWTAEADAASQTDFYGLQALACRAMLEGGECLIRLRPRRPEDGLTVPLQLQLLEAEHLPMTLNVDLPPTAGASGPGNVVRSGIEFDGLGRRVAYHLYRSHPDDGRLAPMSGQGGLDTVRVDASEIIHLYRVLRPGQIRGEPWLSRALVKLNELDQYDDAELVRKKTAAMFAGFVTRQSPEDNLMGEGLPDEAGISLVGLEPGTLQILEPGEDIKFSDPADVGGSYGEFLRTQFRAVAAALGITYEQLTGDLTGVNYSSIRAGLLEFRRRCEMLQHSVLVHQMCRPVWAAWMKQAVLSGALVAPPRLRAWRSGSPPSVPAGEVDPAGLAVGGPREGVQGDAAGHPRRPDEPLGSDFHLRLRRRGHRPRDRRRQRPSRRARPRFRFRPAPHRQGWRSCRFPRGCQRRRARRRLKDFHDPVASSGDTPVWRAAGD
ncbi:hypothetical protein RSSE_c0923 [Ralstonia solanacearum]|nr:hypothetical protein RSSE_c0923 [Ralstonia solanacearum]